MQLASINQKELILNNEATIFTAFLMAFCLLGQRTNFIA